MTKNTNQVHVVHEKEKWKVKIPGHSKARSVHETKKDAIEKAREIAKKNKSELKIHTIDGKISESNSYGNDPNPPKDTNN